MLRLAISCATASAAEVDGTGEDPKRSGDPRELFPPSPDEYEDGMGSIASAEDATPPARDFFLFTLPPPPAVESAAAAKLLLLPNCCWRVGEGVMACGAIGGSLADSASMFALDDGGDEGTWRTNGQRL